MKSLLMVTALLLTMVTVNAQAYTVHTLPCGKTYISQDTDGPHGGRFNTNNIYTGSSSNSHKNQNGNAQPVKVGS